MRSDNTLPPVASVPFGNGYYPRWYQSEMWSAIDAGARYLVRIHPRRAGKDLDSWNILISQTQKRIGSYFYCFPTNKLARKAIFEGKDEEGRAYIDYIPPEWVERINRTEMTIYLKNGSIIYIFGLRDVDISAVGSNPIGVLLSEYSIMSPKAWNYISPIIAKNGGFVIFVYTPRGKNHGYSLYKTALKMLDDEKQKKKWYLSKLTVDDIRAVNPEAYPDDFLESEKMRISGELRGELGLYYQEYFTDFEAAVVGSYYGAWIEQARQDKRITDFTVNPKNPTIVSLDIGSRDSTAIWFFQVFQGAIYAIDYYEATREEPKQHVDIILSKGYNIREIVLPHDAEHKRYGSEKIRNQYQELLPPHLAPYVYAQERVSRYMTRINLVRKYLPICHIHNTNCDDGISALISYQSKWDEEKMMYKEYESWANNGADSFGEGIRWIERRYKNIVSSPVTGLNRPQLVGRHEQDSSFVRARNEYQKKRQAQLIKNLR